MFTFLSQNMRKAALNVVYVNYHVLIKLFMLKKRWNKWWKSDLFKEMKLARPHPPSFPLIRHKAAVGFGTTVAWRLLSSVFL